MKYYTIYKVTNKINNMIYIGAHITENVNDKYMGSGTNINNAIKKYKKENFKKEILFIFDNKQEMLNKEIELVNFDFINRHDTYNIIPGGGGNFNLTNCVFVRDENDMIHIVNVNDTRYISGELKHINTGTVPVRDEHGNIFKICTSDSRYLLGNVEYILKNKVTTKDKNGNTLMVDVNDWRYLSGELVGINTDKIVVKDAFGNKYRVDKNDSRYLSGELVHINKNIKYTEDRKKSHKISCANINKGDKNGMYNNCFINDGKINKIISNDKLLEYIDKGWHKGRISKGFTGKIKINDGKTDKYVSVDELDIYINDGWILGGRKRAPYK